MAVVFISPKQRQKVFFLVITVMFLLFLVVISFGVFLSKPNESSLVLVFNKPKVNIDMSIFNSDQFENLQPFSGIETQYSYVATDKNNNIETGFISAGSIDQARAALEGAGLDVTKLTETETGRSDPFIDYSQSVNVTPVGLKKKP